MKWQFILGLVVFSSLGLGSEKALAHGVNISHNITQAIEINAQYDTGTPMSNAQVNVYAPDDPRTPWKQGTTDDQGIFIFTPDSSKTGYWEVQVRQAGHGGLISIPVEADTNSSESAGSEPTETASEIQQEPRSVSSDLSEGLNSIQKGLMMGSVIWGCIGTALFFSKYNFKNSSDQDTQNRRKQESESSI